MSLDLLARIDAAILELQAIRSEVAALEGRRNGACGSHHALNGEEAPDTLIEVSTASARYNVPPDTLRFWCRHENVGTKLGARWLVSPVRLRARLERE